ncbi:hypothetical protein IscW_ISCW021218 [Ixodes scapularis]|uniref:Uncharacterized protein n=1 Tax=Ixodes scapularis TaxID=6945 RepID=B7Q946_IXOSC|nr:hypothetical protein IscW_ISCW021218 [Ixodes scapularis]|eukprot:XP_002405591.1 hypothetical protein IscW_ISCW021218 [Ixodes scapularis]
MGPARALWFQKQSSCGRRAVYIRVLNLLALLRKHRAGLFASCSSRCWSLGASGTLAVWAQPPRNARGSAAMLSSSVALARRHDAPVQVHAEGLEIRLFFLLQWKLVTEIVRQLLSIGTAHCRLLLRSSHFCCCGTRSSRQSMEYFFCSSYR